MPKMCSVYKEIKRGNPDKYLELVGNGKYICKKCGRTAADRKNLCCPMEVKPAEEITPQELSYCELGSCENKEKKPKDKKIKKMKEQELRNLVKEEVYSAIKDVLAELKE